MLYIRDLAGEERVIVKRLNCILHARGSAAIGC
jgi:hypothetical protein